jgi:hypothetical protein
MCYDPFVALPAEQRRPDAAQSDAERHDQAERPLARTEQLQRRGHGDDAEETAGQVEMALDELALVPFPEAEDADAAEGVHALIVAL